MIKQNSEQSVPN